MPAKAGIFLWAHLCAPAGGKGGHSFQRKYTDTHSARKRALFFLAVVMQARLFSPLSLALLDSSPARGGASPLRHSAKRCATSPAGGGKCTCVSFGKVCGKAKLKKLRLTTKFSLSTDVNLALPPGELASLARVRDCAAEALPVAETAEAEQGQRSVFCEGVATPEAKAGYRNRAAAGGGGGKNRGGRKNV